jgi:hypothetical protein
MTQPGVLKPGECVVHKYMSLASLIYSYIYGIFNLVRIRIYERKLPWAVSHWNGALRRSGR